MFSFDDFFLISCSSPQETKELLWRLNVTQLPCLVLRKTDRAYVWPVPQHMDTATLLVAGQAWLQRVKEGREEATARWLTPLDERPDRRRLAFNFVDHLYPKESDAAPPAQTEDPSNIGTDAHELEDEDASIDAKDVNVGDEEKEDLENSDELPIQSDEDLEHAVHDEL